jgi:hypothetical protein
VLSRADLGAALASQIYAHPGPVDADPVDADRVDIDVAMHDLGNLSEGLCYFAKGLESKIDRSHDALSECEIRVCIDELFHASPFVHASVRCREEPGRSVLCTEESRAVRHVRSDAYPDKALFKPTESAQKFLGEAPWGTRQPRLDDHPLQVGDSNGAERDEDGGISIEMRCREVEPGLLRQPRGLLALV